MLAATAVIFLITLAAFAVGLSEDDYEYLKTQNRQRDEAPVLDLSPKERSRVHDLINDPQSVNDPAARDKRVKDALDIILGHQLWDKAHPGELWDVPRK